MDALTFQAEVKQVQKLLFRIAWSYMGNLQDVEDVVQDAIGMAWAKRNTLRDESQFGAWISRILANRCKNVLRKRKLMSFFPLEEDSVTVDPPVIETPVEEALNSLPPELRLVMSLHYYNCGIVFFRCSDIVRYLISYNGISRIISNVLTDFFGI